MDKEEWAAWLEHPATKLFKKYMKALSIEAEETRANLNPIGMVSDDFLKYSIAYLSAKEAFNEIDNLLTEEGFETFEEEDNEG